MRERGLLERAMVSTMELSTLARIGELEPGLRRGWTYPKVTKDWASKRWAKAPMLGALAWMRQRLPGLAARELPRMGVEAMWVYHPLVSRRLARITDLARRRADRLDRRRPRSHGASWSPPASTASAPTTPASSSASDIDPSGGWSMSVNPFGGGTAAFAAWLDGARRRRRRRVAAALLVFTADSISSAVKPPTASPSSA